MPSPGQLLMRVVRPSPTPQGTCNAATGACVCWPGAVGDDCSDYCSGRGSLTWPTFNSTFRPIDWDTLHGPYLGGTFTSGGVQIITTAGGLFDTSAAYGVIDEITDATLGRCACTAPSAGQFGFTGPFCGADCPDCGEHGACVANATGGASCACSATDPNSASTVRARGALQPSQARRPPRAADCK
jgi:hypothetical protein